jgi:hypothetical protein
MELSQSNLSVHAHMSSQVVGSQVARAVVLNLGYLPNSGKEVRSQVGGMCELTEAAGGLVECVHPLGACTSHLHHLNCCTGWSQGYPGFYTGYGKGGR